MDPTQYKAGLQIAIRRGDISLAWLCFDTLWANPGPAPSIEWEAPLIILEDVWYAIGSFARFEAKIKELADADQRKSLWWSFLSMLCRVPKSKDVHALFDLSRCVAEKKIKADKAWKKNAEFGGALGIVQAEKPLDYLQDCVGNLAENGREFTDYEQLAITYLGSRCEIAGTVRSIGYCYHAIALILARGLPEDEIKKILGAGFTDEEPEALEDFPLDAYSHRSDAGTKALDAVSAKLKVPRRQIEDAWFLLDECNVTTDTINFVDSLTPQPWETYWWLPYLSKKLAQKEEPARATVELWDSTWKKSIEKELKKLVSK